MYGDMENLTESRMPAFTHNQPIQWHVVELGLTLIPKNPAESKQCDDYRVDIVGAPDEITEKVHQWLENNFKFPDGIQIVEVDVIRLNVVVGAGHIRHSLSTILVGDDVADSSEAAE